MADCLSAWAYPAKNGMIDVSAHGDEAENAEAKKITDMERMTEEDGVKCLALMAAVAPLGRRVSRAVRVLAAKGAVSDKHFFLELCLQYDGTNDYAKSEAFESEYWVATEPHEE